jgi:hypothetical protein
MPIISTTAAIVAHNSSRFSRMARLRAVAVEQECLYVKPHPARDDRQQHEQEEIITGKARRNGYDLIRDRGQSLDQDDPAAPLRVGCAEGVDPVAIP